MSRIRPPRRSILHGLEHPSPLVFADPSCAPQCSDGGETRLPQARAGPMIDRSITAPIQSPSEEVEFPCLVHPLVNGQITRQEFERHG